MEQDTSLTHRKHQTNPYKTTPDKPIQNNMRQAHGTQH